MFKIVTKLKKLKQELKMLNKEQCSNIELQADLAKKKLLDIQERIHVDPSNVELHNSEHVAKEQYN